MPEPAEPLVTIEQVLFLHVVAIEEFGGSAGIRDVDQLRAAIARPAAGFGDVALFETPFLRAAALMEALLHRHPFLDGNKRVAVLAAAFWLEREGFELVATEAALYDVTIAAVTHETDVSSLAAWFEANCRQILAVAGGRTIAGQLSLPAYEKAPASKATEAPLQTGACLELYKPDVLLYC